MQVMLVFGWVVNGWLILKFTCLIVFSFVCITNCIYVCCVSVRTYTFFPKQKNNCKNGTFLYNNSFFSTTLSTTMVYIAFNIASGSGNTIIFVL